MNSAIIKELIMTGMVLILIITLTYIAYWFGERNGMNKEREYIISVINNISVTSFATDIQYGVTVAIGHIGDILRKET